jgi:methionine-rich copper-binding protein CopC
MSRRLALSMIVGLTAASLPIVVSAHSELDKSDPADGANLQTAPTEVVLTFNAELDPAGSKFTVTDAGGVQVGSGAVDLNVAARNIVRGRVSITKPGTYRIAWTSLSLDGDQLKGTVTFGYRVSSPPNSSLLARQGTAPLPFSLAGIMLLAVAGLLVARRAALR